MRSSESTSWQMSSDVSEELQFCGFIGQREGFRLVGAPAGTAVEAAWRNWWEELLARGRDSRLQYGQLARDTLGLPPHGRLVQLRELATRRFEDFGPPTFPGLADVPELQRLCQQYWPRFQSGWGMAGGERWELTQRLIEQQRRVRLDIIVHSCATAANKSAPAPFTLYLDFVGWPADYRRALSTQYLVLGADYLDEARAADFAAVLRDAVSALI